MFLLIIILTIDSFYSFSYGGHILVNKTNNGRSDLGPVLLGGIECPWNSEDLDQCSERLWAFKDFRYMCSSLHAYTVELECRSDPFPGNYKVIINLSYENLKYIYSRRKKTKQS